MRKNYLQTVLFVLLIITSIRSIAQTGIDVPQLHQVDQTVLEFMNQWDIPGGSVALAKDGKLLYAKGFGYANQETQEVVSPNHRFRIASLSKPITSLAILKLKQENKIDIDAVVFGPEGILNTTTYSRIQDPRIYKITVRHLLQHIAGWDRDESGDPMFDPVHIARAMNVPPPASSVTVIQHVLTQSLDFEPGTRYAYSNIGYCILGRIIEKITGTSYEHYVKDSLLYPLGITSLELGKNLLSQRLAMEVKYYESMGESRTSSVYGTGTRVPWTYGGFNLEAMDAHGGWIASATDLLRLMTALDSTNQNAALLDAKSLKLMTTASTVNPSYAMGWQVNARGNWWHTGCLPGTTTLMAHTSGGYTWTVLFNRRPLDPTYFQALDRLMWNSIKGITEWPAHDLFQPTFRMADSPSYSLNNTYSITEHLTAKVYPNPNAGEFQIEIEDEDVENIEIVISNDKGQVVNRLNMDKDLGPWKHLIRMEEQPNGIYFVEINTSRGSTKTKIVKTAN